jgi:hypothetical protein
MKAQAVERVLARLRQVFATLPEIAEGVDGHGHTTFKVGTKTLAMLGEHDGFASLSMKSDRSTQAELIKRKDFWVTPYVGQHGWVSTGGTVKDIDWDVVQMIVTATFRRVAPKRLVAKK